MFMSKAGGPRLPDLCSPEVLISLVLPQNEHAINNVQARPCRISFFTLCSDSGPKCVNPLKELRHDILSHFLRHAKSPSM